jgi:hypothetical protein
MENRHPFLGKLWTGRLFYLLTYSASERPIVAGAIQSNDATRNNAGNF